MQGRYAPGGEASGTAGLGGEIGWKPAARPARLRDVAEAAGVSTATVSRALAVPGRVGDATRRRVVEAARALGYTPNEAARALRAGASRMVLVLIPQRCSEVFYGGVLTGIDAELSAAGYTTIMGSLEGDAVKARRLSDLVLGQHLDGVISVTAVPTVDGRSILDLGVPVVSICVEIGGGSQAVLVDDEGCARAQAEHLIALGHRRLMFVCGTEGQYNAEARRRGFARAAAAAGLGAAALWCHPGDYSLASGGAAARSFLARRRRPTGVACCSDEMAIGFIKGAAAAGVRCPADVSVVGFDDVAFASYCEPELTTVRQPRVDMGAAGARALLATLRGEPPAPGRRVVLPAGLVLRASTGPAPGIGGRAGP